MEVNEILELGLEIEADRRLRGNGTLCCGEQPRFKMSIGAAKCATCGSLWSSTGNLLVDRKEPK